MLHGRVGYELDQGQDPTTSTGWGVENPQRSKADFVSALKNRIGVRWTDVPAEWGNLGDYLPKYHDYLKSDMLTPPEYENDTVVARYLGGEKPFFVMTLCQNNYFSNPPYGQYDDWGVRFCHQEPGWTNP